MKNHFILNMPNLPSSLFRLLVTNYSTQHPVYVTSCRSFSMVSFATCLCVYPWWFLSFWCNLWCFPCSASIRSWRSPVVFCWRWILGDWPSWLGAFHSTSFSFHRCYSMLYHAPRFSSLFCDVSLTGTQLSFRFSFLNFAILIVDIFSIRVDL